VGQLAILALKIPDQGDLLARPTIGADFSKKKLLLMTQPTSALVWFGSPHAGPSVTDWHLFKVELDPLETAGQWTLISADGAERSPKVGWSTRKPTPQPARNARFVLNRFELALFSGT